MRAYPHLESAEANLPMHVAQLEKKSTTSLLLEQFHDLVFRSNIEKKNRTLKLPKHSPAPINHFNQKRGDIQLFVYLLVWFGGAGKILPLLSNSSRDHQSLGFCSEGYYFISYRRAFRIQKIYDGRSQKSLNMVVQ